MTLRLGPAGAPAVGQTAAVASVEAIAHTRQQAGQPSLASLLGKSVQAAVLARLADGTFLVRVNDLPLRMPLPAGTQAGSELPLTLVALAPRPTFQLQGGPGAMIAFAEAGPPAADGADPHAAPLALLEGRQAAALARSAAILAGAQAMAPLPEGGADSATASLSRMGKLLGEVIAAAQTSETPATAVPGRVPLLAAPGQDSATIAGALRDGLDKSGLFYESHVAEWAQGERSLGALAAEPQARDKAPLSDPATAQLINLQLNAQEHGRIAWQGQLWPGQDLHWEVERDGGTDGEIDGGTWQSRLRLRFGALGEVNAHLMLSGSQLHIRLDAASETAGERLQAGGQRLAAALAAAGTPLSTLAIHAAHGAAGADDGPE